MRPNGTIFWSDVPHIYTIRYFLPDPFTLWLVEKPAMEAVVIDLQTRAKVCN
jgi:hypothetical protein